MADRIVIMVHGKIKCSGRPPFLKEKYVLISDFDIAVL